MNERNVTDRETNIVNITHFPWCNALDNHSALGLTVNRPTFHEDMREKQFVHFRPTSSFVLVFDLLSDFKIVPPVFRDKDLSCD